MNWFERLWAWVKAPPDVQTPDFLRAGISPFGGNLPGLHLPDAQAELYQRLSWVYIATTLVAQTAAGTPFNVMRLAGEKTEQIENHPFELLLKRPNPLQSRLEFLEAVIGFRTLTGNTYIWLNRSSPTAPPSELWVIPASQIEPIPDQRLYLRGYAYDPGDGRKIPLEPWEICHFKRFHPRNRFVGLSPIEALAVTATGDMAMAKWNTNFFDTDYAKPAGALAFADPINDSDWNTLKADIKRQHGGTERRMMLLRNAGKSGVSWLQMGVNQKDMEFLAARTFNKEEIFAAIAPGLSSMLAVNATEANSVAGKATFSELTVWPIHQALGEKFSADILPAYGDGLVGAFEDVRISDRTMDLQEQQTAFRVLTIQEARERYYHLPPLGDARDVRLVADATAPAPTANAPVERVTPEPTAAPSPEETPPPAKRSKASFGQPDGAVILKLNGREDLLITQQILMRLFADGTVFRVTPFEDLHITLLQCSLVDEQPFTELAQEIGAAFKQGFEVECDTVGIFPASDGATPIVLFITIEDDLQAFQADVAAKFMARGILISEYSQPENWTPHITLGYIESGAIEDDFNYPSEFAGLANVLQFSRGDFDPTDTFVAPAPQADTSLRAELLRWQRKAWKRVKGGQDAACDFESDVIPPTLNAAIQGALEAAQDRAAITGIFDNAMTWGAYP